MLGLKFKLNSDMPSIQSDVDFYLRLTSVSDMKSLKALRKEMFESFEKDEDLRYMHEYQQTHGDTGGVSDIEDETEDDPGLTVDFSEQRVPQQEKEVESEKIYVSEGVILEDIEDDVDPSIPHGVYLEESNTVEWGKPQEVVKKDYVPHGVFLEDISSLMDIQKEREEVDSMGAVTNENISYVQHGVFLEDIVAGGVGMTQVSQSKEYVSNGVFLEDIEGVASKVTVTHDTATQSGKDYVSHGVYLEDINVEEYDEVKEDYVEDSSDWGEDVEGADEEDESDWSQEEQYEGYEEYEEQIIRQPEEQEQIIETPPKEELSWDSSSSGGIQIEDLPKFDNRDIPEPVVEHYTDVRDFVKKHRNCSFSDVYQYFSKKEVQRALDLGKIHKEKGRLAT